MLRIGVEAADQDVGRFLSSDPVATRSLGDNFNRYAYALGNPYKIIDPDGRNGIIVETARGNIGINIPIKFVGPAATPQNIAAIKADVVKRGNFSVQNGSGNQYVAIHIVDVTASTPRQAVNTITLTNGPTSNTAQQGASYVSGNRTSGEWNVQSRGMPSGEAFHEAIHLVGGQDHYAESTDANGQRVTIVDSGWNGNIAGQLPGVIDSKNLQEIRSGANGAQNITFHQQGNP
ncbi:RHS repeat-associated core domain-containing protein [Xanthomonas graminis]|uniref:RHS repeat-associated core domain-containing protein n=1 Tax=Xanthomonas graminis TaxID=3390026 RepID=UPI002540DA7A|nr:RHS repeat-associated core domain-containing protein [Xanthomonas translucens]